MIVVDLTIEDISRAAAAVAIRAEFHRCKAEDATPGGVLMAKHAGIAEDLGRIATALPAAPR